MLENSPKKEARNRAQKQFDVMEAADTISTGIVPSSSADKFTKAQNSLLDDENT